MQWGKASGSLDEGHKLFTGIWEERKAERGGAIWEGTKGRESSYIKGLIIFQDTVYEAKRKMKESITNKERGKEEKEGHREKDDLWNRERPSPWGKTFHMRPVEGKV